MKVIWTPKAQETFNSNLDYLITEWGDKVCLDFINRVDEVILRIQQNPNLYPTITGVENLHRCVVVKQISLYYRVMPNNQIGLITFWNNYQDPEKLKI